MFSPLCESWLAASDLNKLEPFYPLAGWRVPPPWWMRAGLRKLSIRWHERPAAQLTSIPAQLPACEYF
jgi:hypothetical protein